MTDENFETGIKKGRGMARQSLDLIEAMRNLAEAAQPITGRGIGYKLFAAGLIPSMARSEMARVYRLLKEARERDLIPWDWIVDETRSMERVSTSANPAAYARAVESARALGSRGLAHGYATGSNLIRTWRSLGRMHRRSIAMGVILLC